MRNTVMVLMGVGLAAFLLFVSWFLVLPKEMVVQVEAAGQEEAVPFEARWAHSGETLITGTTPHELELRRLGWASRTVEVVSLKGPVDVELTSTASGRAVARNREAVALTARPGGVAVGRPD